MIFPVVISYIIVKIYRKPAFVQAQLLRTSLKPYWQQIPQRV